jgi:glycosyltransferase involved in cell wall biosynthesis
MEATTLQRAGYQVTVICPTSEKHPKFSETIDGVAIRRFPLLFEGRGTIGMLWEYVWSLSLMTLMTTWQALKSGIRVVHICNPPDLLFLCAFPAKLLRRSRLVFDQHDLGPELWEAKGQSTQGLIGRLIVMAERATYRAADVVISTNQSYRDIAIGRGRKSRDCVFVVRSAPRQDFALGNLLPARELAAEARLVYLGTMGSQEGIDLLLEAMAMMRQLLPDVTVFLDLIGDGPERPHLESIATTLNISDRCTFHGRVNDQELRSIVSHADLAVNPDRPSTMNDLSSMNKVVEYMALGVPLVQFACTEGERTALDAGLSVHEPSSRALADSICALLIDIDKRQLMKQFGWNRFRADLCWETQTDTLLSAYEQICSVGYGTQRTTNRYDET